MSSGAEITLGRLLLRCVSTSDSSKMEMACVGQQEERSGGGMENCRKTDLCQQILRYSLPGKRLDLNRKIQIHIIGKIKKSAIITPTSHVTHIAAVYVGANGAGQGHQTRHVEVAACVH